jgi:hypothetical protein
VDRAPARHRRVHVRARARRVGRRGAEARDEREIPRVQALLDRSQFSTNGTYVSIVVLLIVGVGAAFIAGLWGRGWIWAATGLGLILWLMVMKPF